MKDKPRLNKKPKRSHLLKRKIYILIILVVILLAFLIVFGNPLSNNEGGLITNSELKGNLSITVTGDVMFGRKTPAALDDNPYRYVADVIKPSDILLVNTENPFTTSSDALKPDVPLKADPKYISLLNGTDGKLISANANNHVCDYGVSGMQDSIKNLDAKNITHIGAGNNKAEATKPYTEEINGHKITIFNWMDSKNFAEYSQEVLPKATDDTPGYSAWDDQQSPAEIKQAKENGSDIVIVYMHYGNEYSRSPNEDQKEISHKAIDSGADIVVGAHAHVTQGIEMYQGKPIFYNLGNFIFDQSNSATQRAYFVNFNITDNNITATVYPVNINGYLPHYMTPSEGKILLEELQPQCNDLTITDKGTGELHFKLNTTP